MSRVVNGVCGKVACDRWFVTQLCLANLCLQDGVAKVVGGTVCVCRCCVSVWNMLCDTDGVWQSFMWWSSVWKMACQTCMWQSCVKKMWKRVCDRWCVFDRCCVAKTVCDRVFMWQNYVWWMVCVSSCKWQSRVWKMVGDKVVCEWWRLTTWCVPDCVWQSFCQAKMWQSCVWQVVCEKNVCERRCVTELCVKGGVWSGCVWSRCVWKVVCDKGCGDKGLCVQKLGLKHIVLHSSGWQMSCDEVMCDRCCVMKWCLAKMWQSCVWEVVWDSVVCDDKVVGSKQSETTSHCFERRRKSETHPCQTLQPWKMNKN